MVSGDEISILRIGGAKDWRPSANDAMAGRFSTWSLHAPAGATGQVIEAALADPVAEAAFARLLPAGATPSDPRLGSPLREILYREDIPAPDVLLIHSAKWLAAGLAEAAGRPRLVQVADASAAWIDAAAALLHSRGYQLRRHAHGLLAECDQSPARISAAAARAQVEAGLTDQSLPEALAALAAWRRAGPVPTATETACIEAGLARFHALHAAGETDSAERIIAQLAALRPGHAGLLRAALSCNLALGQARRAARFARALLPLAPHDHLAHLALVDGHVARGDRAAEAESRRCIALAPPGGLHPMRQLHDAHRALSLLLMRPRQAVAAGQAAALAGMAQAIDPGSLAEQSLRHWAAHYRCLVLAAEPAWLTPPLPATPLQALPLCTAAGRPLAWAGLRRRAAWRAAELFFLVAADAQYLRLYGRAYIRSVLHHVDVAAMVVVHVIGGDAALPALAADIGIADPRLVFTADDFDPEAVTTICHDSDGPRPQPVAHFQCARFAIAERLLAETGRPVIISDIDALLQRGVADLLAHHADHDVVLNRNARSESFGSHLTANLLLLRPGGQDFARCLRGYLERALAAPVVSRWIDQCGLQMAWWEQAARGTRFGCFDTELDINNVIYPRWMPNPFRFLSLYHGFDMASLPA